MSLTSSCSSEQFCWYCVSNISTQHCHNWLLCTVAMLNPVPRRCHCKTARPSRRLDSDMSVCCKLPLCRRPFCCCGRQPQLGWCGHQVQCSSWLGADCLGQGPRCACCSSQGSALACLPHTTCARAMRVGHFQLRTQSAYCICIATRHNIVCAKSCKC